jgi:hypothetical protein
MASFNDLIARQPNSSNSFSERTGTTKRDLSRPEPLCTVCFIGSIAVALSALAFWDRRSSAGNTSFILSKLTQLRQR